MTIDTLRSRLAAFSARRRTFQELNRLDERSLEDIGFNRAEVDIYFG